MRSNKSGSDFGIGKFNTGRYRVEVRIDRVKTLFIVVALDLIDIDRELELITRIEIFESQNDLHTTIGDFGADPSIGRLSCHRLQMKWMREVCTQATCDGVKKIVPTGKTWRSLIGIDHQAS